MEETNQTESEETVQTTSEQYIADKLKELEERVNKQSDHSKLSAKQLYAMKQVLKKHNISFNVDDANLNDLVVDSDGNVAGVFSYDPPNVQMGKTAFKNSQAKTQEKNLNTLTEHDIKGMTLDQINQNWEQISTLLSDN